MLTAEGTGRKVFNVINIFIVSFLTLVSLYPMAYVAMASISEPVALLSFQGILLKPQGFFLEGYLRVIKNEMIIRGYLNTIFIVVAGVSLNLFLTSLGAYFLSRKGVLLKKFIMFFIVFTMYFNGGLIPFYMTVKQLGIDNSLWALILPVAINTFNLIIMRTAFMAIPDSIEESARIDGARHWTILFRIILPLSMSTVAVILLYYGVAHWNAFFNAMIFIRDRKLYPLQLVLREILLQNQLDSMSTGVDVSDEGPIGEVIKYAVIIVSTLPVLILYPFLQKYFVKGVMIGALKG